MFSFFKVLFMQFYIFTLNTWGCIEFGTHLLYKLAGGEISFYSQEERAMQLAKVARDFDPEIFLEHEDCVICFEKFEAKKSKVTVLPCDVRHYFHSDCIEKWTLKKTNCPLCKAKFSVESIFKFNKQLTKHLKKKKSLNSYGQKEIELAETEAISAAAAPSENQTIDEEDLDIFVSQ